MVMTFVYFRYFRVSDNYGDKARRHAVMEEDLALFLRSRKIPNRDILRMQTDKVDKAVLSLLTDEQMANYLPSYGDRVATLSFCRQNKTSTNKEELLQRLKENMGLRKKKSKTATRRSMDSEKQKNPGEKTYWVKTTRMVEIGWLNFCHNEYRQVRRNNGGGTRHTSLEKTTTMADIVELAKGLFFPDGKSPKGPVEDFTFLLSDFKGQPLPPNVTVAEVYELTKLKQLRFYLCSKENTQESSEEQEDKDKDSDTFSDDFNEEEDVQASSTDSDVTELLLDGGQSPPKRPKTPEQHLAADALEGCSHSTPTHPRQKSTRALEEDLIDLTEGPNTQALAVFVREHTYSTALGMDDTVEWTPGDFTGETDDDDDDDTTVIVKQKDLLEDQEQQEELPEINNEEVPVPTKDKLSDNIQRVSIRRVKIVDDLLAVFMNDNVLNVSLKMEIVNEKAVDNAGVSREIYTAFWEQFLECCEGEDERVPRLRPDFGNAEWQAVGRIWVKGLIDHGVMPVQLSKAFILASTHGIDNVDEAVLMSSFLNYLPLVERSAVERALKGLIDENNEDDLLDLFTRMGSHSLPSKNSFKEAIQTMAHKAILQEPKFVIDSFTLPMAQAKPNFSDKSSVLALYESKQPTGKRVAKLLETTEVMSQREQTTFTHLQRYIKSADQSKAGKILRFCTGSSVICVDKIKVSFNVESGLSRRPIGHTCSATLEVPCTYSSYPEFRTEFDNILSSDFFEMDII